MSGGFALAVLDLFGVFIFALSGALAADRRGMDIFGFVVIGLLPAVGGGTLRDMLLDVPVFWIVNPVYIWLCLIAALLTWSIANRLTKVSKLLVWADALGLSVFCVTGAAKALAVTGDSLIAVMMGLMSSVVGGLIRDVVCNEVPIVLRQDIYATAAFAGALTYVVWVNTFGASALALWTSALLCFWVRGSALVWGWSLPRRSLPREHEPPDDRDTG